MTDGHLEEISEPDSTLTPESSEDIQIGIIREAIRDTTHDLNGALNNINLSRLVIATDPQVPVATREMLDGSYKNLLSLNDNLREVGKEGILTARVFEDIGVKDFVHMITQELSTSAGQSRRRLKESVKDASETGVIEIIDASLAQIEQIATAGVFLDELEIERFEIARFIENFRIAFSRSLDITVNISESISMVDLDKPRMTRIFLNLLTNIHKYGEPQGEILDDSLIPANIAIRDIGDVIEFLVQDFGPGIPDEDLESIFDTGFRLSRHRQNNNGTGRGLSIVKKCVEDQGGSIKVVSDEGVGSQFIISFPSTVGSSRSSNLA